MTQGGEVGSGRFTALMVCTGNIGRSPMMVHLMRREIAGQNLAAVVSITSAGTLAHPGHSMEPGAVRALTRMGVSVDDTGATALTRDLVAAADLVLVATRDHRSEVVGLSPAAVRRTFTLLEMARVAVAAPPPPPGGASSDPGDRMRLAVAWASQVRGVAGRPEHAADDDLADPWGRSDQVYRQTAATVAAAVERIVGYLRRGSAPG